MGQHEEPHPPENSWKMTFWESFSWWFLLLEAFLVIFFIGWRLFDLSSETSFMAVIFHLTVASCAGGLLMAAIISMGDKSSPSIRKLANLGHKVELKRWLKPSKVGTLVYLITLVASFYIVFLTLNASSPPFIRAFFTVAEAIRDSINGMLGFGFFSGLSGRMDNTILISGVIGMLLALVGLYWAVTLGVNIMRWSFKKQRVIFLVMVMATAFISGIDRPLVNLTINRPDYHCDVEADCSMKVVSEGNGCERYSCVNTKWSPYQGILSDAFALICFQPPDVCACRNNLCIDGIAVVTNESVCHSIENPSYREKCYSTLARNLNDELYCEMLQDESDQRECRAHLHLPNQQ